MPKYFLIHIIDKNDHHLTLLDNNDVLKTVSYKFFQISKLRKYLNAYISLFVKKMKRNIFLRNENTITFFLKRFFVAK